MVRWSTWCCQLWDGLRKWRLILGRKYQGTTSGNCKVVGSNLQSDWSNFQNLRRHGSLKFMAPWGVGRFTKVTFNSRQKILGHHFGEFQGNMFESAIRFIKFPECLIATSSSRTCLLVTWNLINHLKWRFACHKHSKTSGSKLVFATTCATVGLDAYCRNGERVGSYDLEWTCIVQTTPPLGNCCER
jgi:hypothetical protein